MKISFLVDNNTISGSCFSGESGLSCYIECDGKKFLVDTGRTDLFMKSADRLGLNLLDVDAIILTHGHYDHTWGLQYLVPKYIEASYEKKPYKKPMLIAHPDTYLPKEAGGKNIGILMGEAQLAQTFDMKTTREPVWLTEHLVFLSEIERTIPFEAKKPLGHTLRGDTWEDDYLMDDSGLAYVSDSGLVVLTGRAQAGVCNTVEYAKKVCHTDNIRSVVGGFHLLRDTPEVLTATTDYLKQCNAESIYPCHCTSLNGKAWLAQSLPVKEIGVGMAVKF